MHALRSADPALPRIDDVEVVEGTGGKPATVRVSIAAHHAAGTYEGLLLDAGPEGTLTEIAGVVNYYLNGHSNKLSLDVTFLDESDDDINFFDTYTGIQPLPGAEDSAILIRFQWQLAL